MDRYTEIFRTLIFAKIKADNPVGKQNKQGGRRFDQGVSLQLIDLERRLQLVEQRTVEGTTSRTVENSNHEDILLFFILHTQFLRETI